ncbi:hypothetical protein JTB14_004743 [Gonioctena quinquepunctata]|nr:hypothetical protein JTB14_004743 [Gonioctena quinquepunctata]
MITSLSSLGVDGDYCVPQSNGVVPSRQRDAWHRGDKVCPKRYPQAGLYETDRFFPQPLVGTRKECKTTADDEQGSKCTTCAEIRLEERKLARKREAGSGRELPPEGRMTSNTSKEDILEAVKSTIETAHSQEGVNDRGKQSQGFLNDPEELSVEEIPTLIDLD